MCTLEKACILSKQRQPESKRERKREKEKESKREREREAALSSSPDNLCYLKFMNSQEG